MDHEWILDDVRIWDPETGICSGPGGLVMRGGRIIDHISASDLPDLGDSRDPSPQGKARRQGAGAVIVPGFVDAHLHLLMAGEHLTHVDLSIVGSREAFEEVIAEAHRRLPSGEWLIAAGWDEANWGGSRPDRTWLRGAPGRPVVCFRRDLHAALCNEVVMELLDSAIAAGDPPGGEIVRCERSGEPTGLFLESAAWQLVKPRLPSPSVTARCAGCREAARRLLQLGVTTAGTMESFDDAHAILSPLSREIGVRCRVTLLNSGWPLNPDVARTFNADDRFAVIGFKSFLDGTIGSSTAHLLAPYADAPASRGLPLEHAAEGRLHHWIRAVAEAGWQPAMHAIGDAAVRTALGALEAIGDEAFAVRARIEHAQQVHPDDLPRFRGRIASMQPLHAVGDSPILEARLGAERAGQAYPFRALLDAGAMLAFGSDWPVVPPDPLAAIRYAVTGIDAVEGVARPSQRLTVEEAFAAHTLYAAKALRLDEVGALRRGWAADAVLFEDDPFTFDWTSGVPRIAMVMAQGEIVWSPEESTD